MSSSNSARFRESLIKHLARSRQYHYKAKKILKLETKNWDKTVKEVAEDENLTFWKLKKKVEILKEKQTYFALKNALEADPINPDIYNIAIKYKFAKISLDEEMNKRRTMGRQYRFDPVIHLQKVFTFSEENKIMNNLCAWEGTNDCKCQLCALIHLSDIAYKSAKEKATCPKTWGPKADLKWLYYFEMRHTKLFRKNFDSVKECKNFQSQVLQLFIEQHISGSSSSSASIQGNQSSSSNVPPMVEKEPEASGSGLQHPYDDVSLQSSPRAPQQEGSESHQDPNVPRKRKRMESQSSSRQSSCDLSSQANTPRVPQQEGFESYQKDFDVHIKEYIKKHINLSKRLTEAANKVLYKNKNLIDIALENDLDLWILQRNVEISKRTNVYLERKFKDAIDDFNSYVNKQDSNKKKLSDIARKNDIGKEFKKHLKNEVRRQLKSKRNYIYDETIISYEVFTSAEEREILKQLYQSDTDCYCELCAMEYLMDLAYIFAKQKNKSYPSVWDKYEKVNALWLLEFYMRNRVQMVLYKPTSLCKSSPASTGGSSSLDEQTESTTRPRHQRKCRKVLKTKKRLKIIKGWIKKHVEISDQLDKAAKQVLKENKDIERVAHEYKLDFWILNKKVQIIKFRKRQFDIRRNNDAVNAVKCNILSVSDAAEEYKVDIDLIHDSLKKLKNSDSSVLMTYKEFETDDTVLTLNDEFLLLNNLQRQVKSQDRECECRSCALQKLPSLAYEFAKQKKRRYPFAWNTTKEADVIWICEFEMRHSMEISNYFQNECKAEYFSLLYND